MTKGTLSKFNMINCMNLSILHSRQVLNLVCQVPMLYVFVFIIKLAIVLLVTNLMDILWNSSN